MMSNNNIINSSIDFDKVLNGVAEDELVIDNTVYRVGMLGKIPGNKGGNSWIFKLYDIQNDLDSDEPIGIIKINRNVYYDKDGKWIRKYNKRIDAEIDALKKCRDNNAQYVIRISTDGLLKNRLPGKEALFYRFYTMEVAKCDLKTFMEENILDSYERIKICLELTRTLKELSDLDYYHRDIKPDNFFFFGDGKWKVGDLGLVDMRNKRSIDYEQEFIGPRGWTTPETMNKHLTKESNTEFDRSIDEKSDMFQLGMVFWYVMQGNAPIGCIMEKDFREDNHDLYMLIRTMISHNKLFRPRHFDCIIARLNQIANKYLVN